MALYKKSLPMIPVRKATKSEKLEKLPCEFCRGVYLARKLGDHQKNCILRKNKNQKKGITKTGRMILCGELKDKSCASVERHILLGKILYSKLQFDKFTNIHIICFVSFSITLKIFTLKEDILKL